MEWDFGKTTRKCAGCSNNLPEEEFFYSTLFVNPDVKAKGDNFLRRDYCNPCWEKKPEGVFSFWKAKLTKKQAPKTPREVLVEFFDNLVNPVPDAQSEIAVEARPKIMYLFGLILLRRRIVKIKENILKDNQSYIVFERIPDGKIYEVPEMALSDAELISLKDQFAKIFEFEV